MSNNYLLCYCGNHLNIEDDYIDECICGAYYDELPNDIAAYNKEIEVAINKAKYTGRINIMRVDELLEERLVATINKDQEHLVGALLTGLAAEYPESTLYVEQELRYTFNYTELY